MKRQSLFTFMLLILACMSRQASAQCAYTPDFCVCVDMTMRPDTIICPGSTFTYNFAPDITIPPGCTIDGFSWSPSAGVTPSSGLSPVIPGMTSFTPTAPTTYELTLDAYGPNVLANRDFKLGTSCFTTAYTPYSSGPGVMASTFGQYIITTNPSPWFTLTSGGFSDHTNTLPGATPPFNMMVVNGDIVPNTLLWEESNIPLCPDVDYEFSFWMRNILTGTVNDAQIRVVINGVTFGPFSSTGVLSWQRHKLIYHSPPMGGIAKIQLFDDNLANNANDFALDDMSFRRFCTIKKEFTIDLFPGEIRGAGQVCAGSKITLIGLPAGGSWSATGGAVVDALGNVTGVTGGSAVISYTTPDGCIITKNITVLTNTVSITGPGSVCEDDVIALTGSPASLIWSHSGPLITTSTPGVYDTYTPGVAVVTYTNPTTGCKATRSVTINVTPNPIPHEIMCIGDAVDLAEFPAGGTWTSSNPGVAPIDPITGVVTAVGAGTASMTYTTAAGCSESGVVIVYNCSTGVALGPDIVCEGNEEVLTGLPRGGTWTSSNPSIATIDPVTGVISAVPGAGGGVVTFTYTAGSIVITKVVTIVPPTTACIKTQHSPGSDYSFDFTTGCTGPATIYIMLYDYLGNVVGYPTGYSISVPSGGFINVPYSTIAGFSHGTYTSPANTFRVCVTEVLCNGCLWASDCCDSVNYGAKSTAGISGLQPDDKLIVTPNPSNGDVTIAGDLSSNPTVSEINIEIVDILGKTVFSDKANVNGGRINKNVSLNTSVANGIYLIKMTGKEYSQVTRLLLSR